MKVSKSQIESFIEKYVKPRLNGFCLHQREWLVKVTSIFLHGFLFESRPNLEGFYVYAFIDFLPKQKDFISLVFSDRVVKHESSGDDIRVFNTKPPTQAAERILGAVKASPLFYYVNRPSAESVISGFRDKAGTTPAMLGLASCAVLLGDASTATTYLNQFIEETDWLKENTSVMDERTFAKTLLENVNDIPWCKNYIWDRCEEAIELLKLQDIAKLSGWSRPS